MNNTKLFALIILLYPILFFAQTQVKYYEGGPLNVHDLIKYNRKAIQPKNNSEPYHKLTFDTMGRVISIEGYTNNLKSSLGDDESFVKCQFSYCKNEAEIIFLNEQNKQIALDAFNDISPGLEAMKIEIFRSENSDTIQVSFIEIKPLLYDQSNYSFHNFNVPLYNNILSDEISHSIRFVFKNNNLVEEAYFDNLNHLVNNLSGYALVKFSYNEFDNLLSEVKTDYLGNIRTRRENIYSGKLLTSSVENSENGIKSEKVFRYINQDTLVNQYWFDSANSRINKPNSNIGLIKIHAKAGEKNTSYYDLKDNPVIYIDEELITCECAKKIERFHLKDSIEETFFDLANNQIKKTVKLLDDNSVLFDYLTYKFDKNGNILEVKHIDSLGNPIPSYDGSYKTIYKRTLSGLITQVLTYGINEEQIGNSEIKEFDSLGRLTSIVYLDNLGNLISDGRQGFAKYTYQYDSNNNIIDFKTYGVDGYLSKNSNGYAWFKYQYDSLNNLISLKVYDNLYELEEEATPIYTLKFNYNLKAKLYTIENYDWRENKVFEQGYDSKNQLIKRSYFDELCGKTHYEFITDTRNDDKTIETKYFIYNKKCVLKGVYIYKGKYWDEISIESLEIDRKAAGCKFKDSKEIKSFVKIRSNKKSI